MKGIDVDRVTDYLVEHCPPLEPPLDFELIAGGRSNLTFSVTDTAARRIVLRRPPTSHVLATAHDMGREHRIISALAGSGVPVPPALAFCDDEEVNGAPFYVMDHVDGHILRSAPQAEKALTETARQAAGDDMIDVLSALHGVDVDAVGLGDLGRRGGYIERQLRRWYGQFQGSQEQEKAAGVHRPAPIVDEVHALLAARIPEEREVVIAHGDYKLDNVVLSDAGKVQAVLDWELCTLGVPLADLGTLTIYWADRGSKGLEAAAASALPGFPTRAELADRYARVSGRDISDLPYYVAFGHWKLACIMEGVFARYAAGAMGEQADSVAGLAEMVIHRAGLAKDALDQL